MTFLDMATEFGLRYAFEMNRLYPTECLTILYNGKLDCMNWPVRTVTIESHEHFGRWLMVKKRDIECFYALFALATSFLGLIHGVLSVVRAFRMARLPVPTRFSLRFLYRKRSTADTVSIFPARHSIAN